MKGETVGVVANQPMVLAGCLDIDSSRKGSKVHPRLRRLQHSDPALVDVPGFLPGVAQEYGGVIKHGIISSFRSNGADGDADYPQDYGGAYDVMASKHIGTDINMPQPDGGIAVMGARVRLKFSTAQATRP